MNHFLKIGSRFLSVNHIAAAYCGNSGSLMVETTHDSFTLTGREADVLLSYLDKIAQDLGPVVGHKGLSADEVGMYCVTLDADEIMRFENGLRVAGLHETADLVRTYGVANAGSEYSLQD